MNEKSVLQKIMQERIRSIEQEIEIKKLEIKYLKENTIEFSKDLFITLVNTEAEALKHSLANTDHEIGYNTGIETLQSILLKRLVP